MRSLIVDDELSNRENLSGLLRQYCPAVSIVAEAENVEEALILIRQHKPELVFLDIKLHAQTGFDLLRQLDEIDFEILFVTAFDKYGIEAIKFAALDYLLKPIDIEELGRAVEKAAHKIALKKRNERLAYLLEYLNKDKDLPAKIALPLLNEIRYVPVEDIIRLEANNSYTFFCLATGERILVCQTLKEYDSLLNPHGFIRTHQTHLVNRSYIRSWLKEDGGVLLLKDQTKVPVSKMNRERIKTLLSSQL